jgi:hypothetical protein
MRSVWARACFVLQERDGFVEEPHVVAAVENHVVVTLIAGPA